MSNRQILWKLTTLKAKTDMKRIINSFIFIVLLSSSVVAQTERGEIESGEFVINKDLEIKLPQYDRYFEKIPPLPVDDTEKKTYFSIPDFEVATPPLTPRLRVLKLKNEKPQPAYRNYVRLGFGNYTSPYFEGFITNGNQDKVALDVHAIHLSSGSGPVDDEFSADSHSGINAHATIFGKKATTTFGVNYQRDAVRYYGYESFELITEDSIKQVYQRYGADVKIQNTKGDGEVDYEIDLGYQRQVNSQSNSEGLFNIDAALEFDLSEGFDAFLGASALVGQYKAESETLNRNVYKIQPAIGFYRDDLWIKAGLNMVIQNDTSGTLSGALIYPVIQGEYNILDQFLVYGGIEGDLNVNTWQSFTAGNAFVAPAIRLEHTSKPIEVSIGVKGNIMNEVGYDVGASYGAYKNMAYFVNNPLIPQHFQVVYDDGTSGLLTLRGGLDYAKKDVAGANLKLAYFNYNTNNIDRPWHRPAFESELNVWYNLYDKIRISTDWFYLSGIEALDTDGASALELDNIFDINLSIDYAFSDKYSAFVNVNNMLGKNYQRYYRYPVRGIQVMLGVSASF
ncbi:MAG TPA: hypothetical protein DDY13_13120 [Cytophagales bacterium]|jgi:hypothetical protein|nr:hypothetical protein [Cytophagales bacterium]